MLTKGHQCNLFVLCIYTYSKKIHLSMFQEYAKMSNLSLPLGLGFFFFAC